MNLLFALALNLRSAALARNADWQRLPLTDARTGETFKLGGLGGTAHVEPMAI